MKQVRIIRSFSDHRATLGMLKVNDVEHDPFFTLENPWKNNQTFFSCIPPGLYSCVPFNGNKYKNVYQVMSVPGRSFILFHHGNFEKDTKGCILLGNGVTSLDNKPMVTHSRMAIERFRSLIGEDDFLLEIV